MSRLIFEKIIQNSAPNDLPEPFIERINIVSGLSSAVSSMTDTVDGVEVQIVFYYRAIGKNKKSSPAAILNRLSNLKITAACIFGNEENNKIIEGNAEIFNYLVTHKSALSNWVLATHPGYNPGRHSPNVDARVIPLQLNEASVYEDAGMTIEHLACLVNFASMPFSELTDEGESQIEYSDDMETKYYKFSTTITVPLTLPSDQNITTYEQLMDLLSDDYQNMNVYVFTTPLDWEDLSDSGRQDLRTNYPLISNMSYSLTYQPVFQNNEIVPNEEINFVDSDNNIYDGPVLLDTANVYKPASNSLIAGIIANSETIGSGSAGSAVRKQSDNLKYIVNAYKDDPRLLIELNNYRKLYPNKNDGTPAAEFYNTFKNVYSQALSEVKKSNTVLTKTFSLNPIVFDNREVPVVDAYDQPDVVQATADGDTENGTTRFPKEYITRYAYSSAVHNLMEDETFTWEDEDVICDNGFIFFDYERALRNDTVASSLFNIDKLQLYFGKKLVNGSLALVETTLTKKYVNNAGSATELRTARTIKTKYQHSNETAFGPYASYPSDGETAYVGINYDKVDIGMSGDVDYSYCALRNVVPAGSERYDLGSRVSSAQTATFQDDYRFMSFYFQDYYDISLASDTITNVDGVDYTEQSYTFNIVFNDQSVQLLNSLRDHFKQYMIGEDYSLNTYYDYAVDTGNNNNYTGYFNNFFIEGMAELFSEDPNSAPWIAIPIIFNTHRDIILDTFEGDTEALLRDAANTTVKISPKTGTLEQLENYKDLVGGFYQQFYGISGVVSELISSYTSEMDTDAIRELDYYHEIPTLENIVHAGETYEEYVDDIEMAAAYPIEDSDWNSLSSSSEASYDTSTLYSREEIREQISGALVHILEFIDYLDTTSTADAELARYTLHQVLEPSESSSIYGYASRVDTVATTMAQEWFDWLFDVRDDIDTGVSSSTQLELTSWGLENIMIYMGQRIWPAANYARSEFGTSSQITDFYEFLSVGDSYKV